MGKYFFLFPDQTLIAQMFKGDEVFTHLTQWISGNGNTKIVPDKQGSAVQQNMVIWAKAKKVCQLIRTVVRCT